jgi:hypothetical protein
MVNACGNVPVPSVPYRDPYHPKAESAHGGAFCHRRCGAIAQGHSHHQQADRVITGIAEKIEGVGLQRGRPGRNARADLDREHGGVDGEHSP